MHGRRCRAKCWRVRRELENYWRRAVSCHIYCYLALLARVAGPGASSRRSTSTHGRRTRSAVCVACLGRGPGLASSATPRPRSPRGPGRARRRRRAEGGGPASEPKLPPAVTPKVPKGHPHPGPHRRPAHDAGWAGCTPASPSAAPRRNKKATAYEVQS